MNDLLDQEGIDNGQTPEEACRWRILSRLNKNPTAVDVEDCPEYHRLQNFFYRVRIYRERS